MGVMDGIASAMLESGNAEVINYIDNSIKIDLNILKKDADNFLKKYNYVKNINDSTKNAYSSQKFYYQHQIATSKFNKEDFKKSIYYTNFQKARNQIYKQIDEEAVYDFFEEAQNFEKNIQKFLGNEISTIYMYKGKAGQVELYTLNGNVKEIFNIGYNRSSILTGRYRSDIRLSGTLLSYDKKEYDSTGLDITHSTILERGRYSKNKLKLKSKMKIFWNITGEWKSMDIVSEGDLNEAYVGFYLSKEEFFNKNGIEQNIGYFLTGNSPYAVENVSSASSLLKGDIEVNGKQYAVKSLGASMAGYKQLVDIAYDILDGRITNKEKLRKKINSGTTRNKASRLLEEELDILLSDLKTNNSIGYHFSFG